MYYFYFIITFITLIQYYFRFEFQFQVYAILEIYFQKIVSKKNNMDQYKFTNSKVLKRKMMETFLYMIEMHSSLHNG